MNLSIGKISVSVLQDHGSRPEVCNHSEEAPLNAIAFKVTYQKVVSSFSQIEFFDDNSIVVLVVVVGHAVDNMETR